MTWLCYTRLSLLRGGVESSREKEKKKEQTETSDVMLHRHSVSHMWTEPSLVVYRPRRVMTSCISSNSPSFPFLWLLLHCFTFTVHQTACPSKTPETASPVCCFLLSLSIFLLCLTTVQQLVLYLKKKSFRVSFNYSRKTKSRVEPSSRPQCKKKKAELCTEREVWWKRPRPLLWWWGDPSHFFSRHSKGRVAPSSCYCCLSKWPPAVPFFFT